MIMKRVRYKCDSVNLPWYIPYIYHFRNRHLEVGFLPVLKSYLERLWFWFPDWLTGYNISECVDFIPDVQKTDGSLGDKIKPFFGMVLLPEENACFKKRWWKDIIFVNRKDD